MEIDGTISLDRRRGRRMVSAIAMLLPMVAVVVGAAWFVRAYVAPPMVAIPSPMELASSLPPRPTEAAVEQTGSIDREPDAPAIPTPGPARVAAPAATPSAPATWALPMMASLAFVPPSFPEHRLAEAPPPVAEPQAPQATTPELLISVPEESTDSSSAASAALGPGAVFIVPLPRARPNP